MKTCDELVIRLVAKQESLLKIEELEKSSTTENEIHPEIVVSILENNLFYTKNYYLWSEYYNQILTDLRVFLITLSF